MANLLTGTPRLVGMMAPSGTMDAKILVREKVTRVDPVRISRAVAKVWQLADPLVEAQDVTLPDWTIEEVADSDGPVIEVISAVVDGTELVNLNPATPREHPRWDNESNTLYIGERIARRVKRPKDATNIILVLDCFELDGWPGRIESPLEDDTQVLHNTIRTLNRGLQGMRFSGDGRGEGIVWHYAD